MPVPGFQEYLLPLLKMLKDGKDHTLGEVYDPLASYFNLSKEEINELLPSGLMSRHVNRVQWAKTYLVKAQLLESTGRSKIKITDRGLKVLSKAPKEINIKFLSQFPEFVEFRGGSKSIVDQNKSGEKVEKTLEEILEDSYRTLRQVLADDLLEKVKTCSPNFFEKLVVDLLISMGYGGSRKDAGEAVGQTGDGGIDGVIKEDRLGLDVVYIQAKKWEGTVGRPQVQGFAGSLMGKKANKGVMIATSKFSQDAKDYVKTIDKKIVLIEGDELAQFMIDHNIGVSEESKYLVKKINTDYFEE